MARIFAVTMLLVAFVTGCATMGKTQDMQLLADGFAKIERQDWAGAEADLSRALEINPSNHYAQLNLGILYDKKALPEKGRATPSTTRNTSMACPKGIR